MLVTIVLLDKDYINHNRFNIVYIRYTNVTAIESVKFHGEKGE